MIDLTRHMIRAAIIGSELGISHVASGDYDITIFCETTCEEYGLGGFRFRDLVAIEDSDHSYGRIYSRGALSVGIVTHSDCVTMGHGPGVTTLFTSKIGAIKPLLNPGANIVMFMKLRDDL